MRRRIVIVVSVCIAMPLWFASRHAIDVAPPPCPPADLLLSNGLQLELEKALLRRKRALAGATAGGTLNASSWRLREAAWRDAAELAERARYHTHAQLFGEPLSSSQLTLHSARELLVNTGTHFAGRCPRYTGEYAPFDYWEPEFACACDAVA